MVQVTDSRQALFDRVFTIKPTRRVERLRERFLGYRPAVSLDRVRIETRVMRETEAEPMVTRRAKVFAALVTEMPIDIYADDLIVGVENSRLFFADATPYPAVMEPDGSPLAGLGRVRDYLPGLSDEEIRELREEILPYWRGEGSWVRTRHGHNSQLAPPEVADRWRCYNAIGSAPANTPTAASAVTGTAIHYGHNSQGYAKVLKKGFLGIKEEAEERLSRVDLTDPEELSKIPFLKGVIMAMEAAAEIGPRFAGRARELAEREKDADRQAELLKLAEVCHWVPANPARTFHEALQACYLTYLLIIWESPEVRGQSPGRIDQYLYPYYASDIGEGRLTKEEAQELIDCLFIKLNSIRNNDPHIGVGGLKGDGNDATNELSHMLLEGMMHTRLPFPFIGVQIHSKTPDDLLVKAAQLCSLGTGHPQFFNSEVLVNQFLAKGAMCGLPITPERARTACVTGCVEPVIPGMDAGYSYAGFCNLAAAMEFVLTNGWSRFYQKQIGLETGDPRQFQSFEEVLEAFQKQVQWMLRNLAIVGNITEQTLAKLSPTVYESALIEDCIEKGICREEGGARYNFNLGLIPAGTTDAGDSLTAIRKLVFEDKKITMSQLCHALDRDFEGNEELRQMLLEAPKYGNDDDYADEQVALATHISATGATKYRNTRGGRMLFAASPIHMYVYLGHVTGALPSGRQAWQPLADAFSPSAGNDVNGPTAVIKSMGKIDSNELLGGSVLNLRIDPVVFEDGDGFKRVADFMRAFVDQKIHHVQFNVVSSDILRAAQKEPERYRDLVVKVAGYSAFFVQLPKPLQDGIIARTEHRL